MAPVRSALRGARVRAVTRMGRRRAGSRVILYVLPGSEPAQAAFVAGRRVGGAVERNRARRVLREAWRSVAPIVQQGAEVVFVAKRGILRARPTDLEVEMRALLAQTGVTEA